MSFLRNSVRLLLFSQNITHPSLIDQSRTIKRWVAPVLKELNKRKRKMGAEALTPRSSHLEWNYKAELFAFSKRLHENFDLEKLQQAFIDRSYILQEEQKQRELGIEEPNIGMQDNRELIKSGEALITSYVNAYLRFSLPKMPSDGIVALQNFLTSQETLAYISSHLGVNDLILSSDFPPEKDTLADAFKAVVGSLAASSGEEKAYTFVRDFVCTQLNQKDLTECWNIERPFERLKDFCREQKMGEPEPRIIGEAGKNTVLAVYHVGVYCNKKLIGKGFGENIETAIDMASLESLREFWGFPEYMKSFNFELKLEKKSGENVKALN